MTKRFTYYWHDYMNCQVVVDNHTTEEYPIEDNRVKNSKYDNNGIEYLVELLNRQDKIIVDNQELIEKLFVRKRELEDFIKVHVEGTVADEVL